MVLWFDGWLLAESTKNPGRCRGFGFVHLASFDLDLLLGLDGLRLLGKPHREHAILEACFDLVGVDALRQCEVALEGADLAFMETVILEMVMSALPRKRTCAVQLGMSAMGK
jgi:hypothetical protein